MKKALPFIIIGVVLLFLCIAVGGVAFYFINKAKDEVEDTIAEEIVEDTTGVDIDSDDGTMTFEDDDTSYEIDAEADEWPSDIPSVVPDFDYGSVNGTSKTEDSSGKYWTVTLVDLPENAMDNYYAKLNSNGFEPSIYASGKGGVVSGEKDNVSVYIWFGEDATATFTVTELPE